MNPFEFGRPAYLSQENDFNAFKDQNIDLTQQFDKTKNADTVRYNFNRLDIPPSSVRLGIHRLGQNFESPFECKQVKINITPLPKLRQYSSRNTERIVDYI